MDDAARLTLRLDEARRDKRLWLSELPLEELPPALADLTELQALDLSDLPRLRSARGIERLVGLQRLGLGKLNDGQVRAGPRATDAPASAPRVGRAHRERWARRVGRARPERWA